MCWLTSTVGLLSCDDSSGSYEIAECTNVGRGTKIVIHLNNDSKQFAKTSEIEGNWTNDEHVVCES